MPWNPRETGILSTKEFLELELKLLLDEKMLPNLPMSQGSMQKDIEYRILQIRAKLQIIEARLERNSIVQASINSYTPSPADI